MRISDWSSDVCSSDLTIGAAAAAAATISAAAGLAAAMARAVDPPASARAVVSPMISTTTCRSRSGPELLQNLTLQQKHRVFGAEVGGGRTGRTAAAEEPCPLDRNVAVLEQRDRKSTRLNSSH